MRCFLEPRRVIAALGLLAMAASDSQASWRWRRYETAYLVPSASVLAVPTAAYVPTSYLWPTSTIMPTVYATSASYLTPTVYESSYLTPSYYLSPSAYIAPTSYFAPTSYYVPTVYRPRSYVTRSYLPTTVSYPSITSTSYAVDDCVTTPTTITQAVPAAPPVQSTGPTIRSTPIQPAPEARQAPVNQGNDDYEPILQSEPRPSAEIFTPTPPAGNNPPAPDGGMMNDPTPPPPAGEPAPALEGFPLSDDNQHRVRRPTTYSTADFALRQVSLSQTILEGKVISYASGRPEGNVRVILSDRRSRFTDRVHSTDALGRYAINLPEGDWAVKVEMPSRRVFTVSEITVSGGRITTTDDGREVTALTIKR